MNVAGIRVLVVDDSAVARRVIGGVLDAEAEIEVMTARNGLVALERVLAFEPDVVVLDVDMPELDGLATLKRLKERWPELPVIMCSALTTQGGAATLDALALGAADYVTKPSGTTGLDASRDRLRAELVPRVRAVARCRRPVRPGAARPVPTPAAPVPPRRRGPERGPRPKPAVVVVGVSTGGPQALVEVVPALPGDLAVPVLVVQHMPPVFTRLLAERLDAKSPLQVVEAEAGMCPRAGTVYVAPGDHHMRVAGGADGVRITLDQEPPENSCRPAVDPLFRSAAEHWGPATLAVVLTGMGRDGCRGAEAVVEAGGRVIAQDEATSVVWGMPGTVVRAGLAEVVVPLGRMRDEIVRAVRADPSTIGVR